jgi:two-component system OmpR family sensor kinase
VRLRLRAGLALRIYLASVATVVVALLGLFVALRLAWDPRRDPGLRFTAYPAHQLALRWPDLGAVREEAERIRREAGQSVAVFRWDGAPVTVDGPPPPPLDDRERVALRRTGTFPRRCPGELRPCGTAFALGPAGAPNGYALLGPGMPPPPPLRELTPLALVLIGLGVAAALLGRSIARPLQRLARTAQALGRGELSARTGIDRRDELGEVARAFDEMAARVEALLRSHSELIANVAHELRTPLARIHVALDLAEDGDAEVARSSLAEITEDLGDLERLVEDVLASARMDLAAGAPPGGVSVVRREPVDLAAHLASSADRLRARFPERAVDVGLEAPLPPVLGDGLLLRRALDNLLDNARKYSPRTAPIALRAARHGGAVRIEVRDQGEGIAPEDLPRLFTPFFRADRSRTRGTGGVGLGLALSRRIAEAHGGTLVAASTLGAGTTMTLTLPVHAADGGDDA